MAKLNKKLFGNRNAGFTGGEGVASVTVAGAFTGFADATTTVTFTAPQLPGGVTATGTAIISAAGAVTGIAITNQGGGYTSIPTVTIADSDVGAEVATGTLTAVLTTQLNQSITAYAKTTNATTTAQVADIIKQRSTKRFKVITANGTAICELKSSALSGSASTDTGKMTITAVDSIGGTYFVTKIGARKCTVTRGTGTEFATDSSVPWTLGAAVLNTSVSIPNT